MNSFADAMNDERMCELESQVEELGRDLAQERDRLTLEQLQQEAAAWTKRNFGTQPPWQPLLGVAEEVGELAAANLSSNPVAMRALAEMVGSLAHSELKSCQNIRNNEDHGAKARDAVGDIIIYLAGYCTAKGFSLEGCVEEAWEQVRKRDWTKGHTV